MADLVNMARSAKQMKDDRAVDPEPPKFPFGLSVHLETESMKKLGFSEKGMPSIGDELFLMAKVKVESTHSRDGQDGKDFGMNLQITDMALKSPEEKRNAEDVLFDS